MKDKARIMIVDDEPVLRDLAARTCTTLLDATVEAFADAQSAISRLRNFPTFDLLLIDYLMPEQDGLSFCIQARKDPLTKKVPIVVLTGAGAEVEAYLRAAGANHVLQKPVTPRELADALLAYLPIRQPLSSQPTSDDILRDYVATLPALADSLAAQTDAQDLRKLLHKLKGTSGTFGLMDVSDQARTIEAALKQGETLASQQASMLVLCALLRARGA